MRTPFTLAPAMPDGVGGRLAALALPAIDAILGLSALDRLYAELPAGNFIDAALERLGVDVDVHEGSAAEVPSSGPAIVVANHPTGALDGLALAQALLGRRPDVRLLGNRLLLRIPEMREWTIAVDPFDGRAVDNRRGLREARAWLNAGGVLAVFPAGAVSSVPAGEQLIDDAWQHGVLRLAQWANAAVVPAFIDAQPSRWFRLVGLVHPLLRTALLPRELLRLRGRRVGVRFGEPVAHDRLAALGPVTARAAYLRARTYALAPPVRPNQPAAVPVAASVDTHALSADVATLGVDHELVRMGDYSVFCASADRLPAILQEIGRLRETAFRAVGEGTGRAADSDRFDAHYDHLFVWHRGRREVIGAYRLARTDQVVGRYGTAGLYTNTLFEFDETFLHRLGPAIELGRSFVRVESQRDPAALFLLWKGIGAIVAREPRYQRLIGPVSISATYKPITRSAIAAALSKEAGGGLNGLVRPRHPLPSDADAARLVSESGHLGAAALDRLVAELEGGPGLPVLLRQYLKLQARFLGFSVDPAFGDALDGLMVVDLAEIPERIAARYLGPSASAALRTLAA